MNIAFYIAKKLKLNERMAVVSIAVSFVVMIVSIAISSGFRVQIKEGIATYVGDIQLSTPDLNYINTNSPILLNDSLTTILNQVKGIDRIIPVIYRAAIVKSSSQIEGALFKSTDTKHKHLDSMSVSVPAKLANNLNISKKDTISAYFVGQKLKVRKFIVQDIYEDMLSGTDNLIIYARPQDLRRVNNWQSTDCSTIEILLQDKYRTQTVLNDKALQISDLLLNSNTDYSNLVAQSVYQKYPTIFAWLDLIDTNVVFILILMTIVAGVNMIASLLVILLRNISTIGLLKAMGMNNKTISLIFLKSASNIILKGMFIGNIIALIFCFLQWRFHFIHLDPTNYFLPYVPINLNLVHLFCCALVSYLVILLLLLLPCLFVASVPPSQSVKMK